MARHVSRRVFLAATAASAVACGGIGTQPPTPEPDRAGIKGIDDLVQPGPTPTLAPSTPIKLAPGRPDGFVAVAPRVLRAGGVEAVSLALFAGDQPASGDVRAQLAQPLAADAIVKEMLVEPEGVAREQVENLVLLPGAARELETAFPPGIVPGSGRAYLALTGNVMSQTIEGLEGLLRMPFGCGEQNMILLAPNVFVSRYLKESGQLKPERIRVGSA